MTEVSYPVLIACEELIPELNDFGAERYERPDIVQDLICVSGFIIPIVFDVGAVRTLHRTASAGKQSESHAAAVVRICFVVDERVIRRRHIIERAVSAVNEPVEILIHRLCYDLIDIGVGLDPGLEICRSLACRDHITAGPCELDLPYELKIALHGGGRGLDDQLIECHLRYSAYEFIRQDPAFRISIEDNCLYVLCSVKYRCRIDDGKIREYVIAVQHGAVFALRIGMYVNAVIRTHEQVDFLHTLIVTARNLNFHFDNINSLYIFLLRSYEALKKAHN